MNLSHEFKKVLVIDDDPDIQTVVKCALEMEDDVSVKSLLSGKDAVTEITQFQPDIILLDMMMPDMDGLSVLKMVRGAGVKIPIILFTAKALTSDTESYKQLGAQGVIAKPFNPLTLGSEVKAIWGEVVESKL